MHGLLSRNPQSYEINSIIPIFEVGKLRLRDVPRQKTGLGIWEAGAR